MDLVGLITGFTAWAESVVGAYGYFGIFLVSFVATASIIFPIPSFILVFTMGSVLNPWLVGLAAGLGAAFGEITGYLIGTGGRQAIQSKYKKPLKRVRKWTLRHGIFPVIVFFAATPLPDDVVGVLAGLIRYDFRKFLLASFIGKVVLHTIIAFAGYYSFEAIRILFGA